MTPATAPSLSAAALAAGGVPAAFAQVTESTAPAGDLAGFLGFTALVLTGFLVLARLSQGVVDDDSDDRIDAAGPSRATGPPETATTGGRAEPTEEASPTANHDSAAPNHESAAARNEPAGASHEPAVARNAREAVPPAALLANVALTQGLFGGILAAAAWFFQVPGTALGLAGGRVGGVAAVGIGLAFGTALWMGNEVATALADAAGAGYEEGLRQLLGPGTARGWAILLGGVLPVIALVEEFLFRAAAIGAAGAAVGATGPTAAGAWALAVVSSLAFALGHGAQGRVGVVVTGALGFVLAAGFVLSGSFLVVVVAHYLVNALEFLVHEWAGLPDPVWS